MSESFDWVHSSSGGGGRGKKGHLPVEATEVSKEHWHTGPESDAALNLPPGTCSMKILMKPFSLMEPRYCTMFLCFRCL